MGGGAALNSRHANMKKIKGSVRLLLILLNVLLQRGGIHKDEDVKMFLYML